MTRRQLIAIVGIVVAGLPSLHAAQDKKNETALATVTLIVDGMT